MFGTSISRAIVLAGLLTGGALSGALAEEAVPDGPQSQASAPEKPDCVKSSTSWKEKGKVGAFAIELINSCELRLKCTIDASVMGARGVAQGRGTLVLEPASKGQTASKIYALPVKSLGGMASLSHTCKAI